MRKQCLWLALAVSFTMFAAAPAPAADAYALDTAHAGVTFKISHVGISWTYGRFNELNGDFTIDTADPSKCSFTMNIKSASIDTGNQKRDEHLRSPDFFNVKQYPVITFKSTAVKPAKDGYEAKNEPTGYKALGESTAEPAAPTKPTAAAKPAATASAPAATATATATRPAASKPAWKK